MAAALKYLCSLKPQDDLCRGCDHSHTHVLFKQLRPQRETEKNEVKLSAFTFPRYNYLHIQINVWPKSLLLKTSNAADIESSHNGDVDTNFLARRSPHVCTRKL